MQTGVFALTDEQNLSLWRWVVAAVYVCEMFDTNGSVELKNEQGDWRKSPFIAENMAVLSFIRGLSVLP
jgi:hypothetical protein